MVTDGWDVYHLQVKQTVVICLFVLPNSSYYKNIN